MSYAAFSVQGTVLNVTISSTPTAIPGITSFSLEQGERASIPTTAISDSSEQKLAGFTGAGSLTLELNWDPANAAHADLFLSSTQSGATANRTYGFVYSDTGACAVAFTGFVKNFALKGAVNQPGQATVSIELASAFTITP